MKKNKEKSLHKLCHGYFKKTTRQPINKKEATIVLLLFFFFLFLFLLGAIIFMGWFDASVSFQKSIPTRGTSIPKKQEYPLKCTGRNQTQTCPKDYPTKHNPPSPNPPISNLTCPSYFQYIHEDLRPWKETGITREMIEGARRTAHFRLVIVDGQAYVEKYRQSIQTRDMFTLWGILQLLRWYPGRLPDLELMFDCNDRPVVRSKDFDGPKAGPPPLFRYCADRHTLDIVFPDWSFWGWAETNIRPWKNVLKEIKEGNKRIRWQDRIPFAYWRGNPHVAPTRKDLLKCNVSAQDDWNTRLYIQDWLHESRQGYKESNLGDQCTHKYKIYIEGWAWSVSEKYILACDSMTLYVRSHYYDFYIRGMVPLQHYWPVRDDKKCPSLKFAVEWGKNHPEEARAIGEAGSNFIHEDVKMEFVYDFMFHLLNEYAKLLKFKPTIPSAAVQLCSETMACPATGTHRRYMIESMVMSPSDKIPCTMPPLYDPQAMRGFFDGKIKSAKKVEMWENDYWRNLSNL